MRARTTTWGTATVLAVGLLTACGGSGGTTTTPQTPALQSAPAATAGAETPPDEATIQAAKSEGQLLIYGNTADTQLAPIIAAFGAKYPGIKVSYISLRGGVFQRYLSEQSTGTRTADVLLASEGPGWLDLVQRKQVLDYPEPNRPQLPDYAALAPGVFAMSEDTVIAVFNKALLPEAQQPTTLAGLADMAGGPLKNKIATYGIEDSFGYSINEAYLQKTGEQGWTLLEKLGAGGAKAEAGAATMLTKIAQGQYAASYFVSGVARTAITGDTAKVLNYRYLTDATPLMPRGIGVTAASKSPNAGKVFVNFLLSVEGQNAACKGGFTPYRGGVDCPESVGSLTATFGKDNVIIGSFTTPAPAKQAEIVRRWNAAFGR